MDPLWIILWSLIEENEAKQNGMSVDPSGNSWPDRHPVLFLSLAALIGFVVGQCFIGLAR